VQATQAPPTGNETSGKAPEAEALTPETRSRAADIGIAVLIVVLSAIVIAVMARRRGSPAD
jgi:hypothetical protein